LAQIIYGVLFLIVVTLFPQGLLGMFEALWKKVWVKT